VVLVLVPGPDFAVVTENTLAGGRLQGWSSAVGVARSNAVPGVAATTGFGAVVRCPTATENGDCRRRPTD
jgi:threonine/homoserine/homoserine lactone efflux protein